MIIAMKIKPRPRVTRKQKAYLKWMGLEKPKKQSRLPQLNKSTRHLRHRLSEFILMAIRLEPPQA